MANKYWVGNGTLWSSASSWSTSSGGVSGATAPTMDDDAIFDDHSGNVVVDYPPPATCFNLNCSTFTGSLYGIAVATGLSIYGSMTLSANMLITQPVGLVIAFTGSATGRTITTAGQTLSYFIFNLTGGDITLQDNLTLNQYLKFGYSLMTAGTINLINKTINVAGQTIGDLNDVVNSGTLNITNSTINNNTRYFKIPFNLSVISTGSVINMRQGGSSWFSGNGQIYNTVSDNSTNTPITFTDADTITNLNLTTATSLISTSATTFTNMTLSTNVTVSGGLKLSNGLVTSNTIGTQRTIILNSVTPIINRECFSDIKFNSPIDFSASLAGDCGGNTNITFPASQNQYYKTTGTTCNWSDSNWYLSTNGGGGVGRVPLPQDDAIFDSNSFSGTTTLTVDLTRIGGLNMSGVTKTVTLTPTDYLYCYKSYILGSNITQSGGVYQILHGRGNHIVSTYGKLTRFDNIGYAGGSYTFMSDFNNVSSIWFGGTGTIDFNDFNISISYVIQFVGSNIVYLGNGTITASYTSSYLVWLCNETVTLYCEGSTIKLNPASGSAVLGFQGGLKMYNKVWLSGSHTGTFYFLQSNTIKELIIDAGRNVRFTAGTTQQIGKLTALGTSGNTISISSTTNAQHTLNLASYLFDSDYLDISYSNATPFDMWFAGTNSIDSGNNTGWNFKKAFPVVPISGSTILNNFINSRSGVTIDWRNLEHTRSLYLDAGHYKSYKGSGTTWVDIATKLDNNGYDGTLINGPTFDSNNGGSIYFDGINDTAYVPGGGPSGSCTLEFVIKRNSNVGSTNILSQSINYSFRLDFRGDWAGDDVYFLRTVDANAPFAPYGDSGWGGSAGKRISVPSGFIYHITFTHDVLTGKFDCYKNGVFIGTADGFYAGWPVYAKQNFVGLSEGVNSLYLNSNFGTVSFTNDNFYLLKNYNRVLTADEILQNYNNVKYRFPDPIQIFSFNIVNTQLLTGLFSTATNKWILVDWGDGSFGNYGTVNSYGGIDQAYSKDYLSVGNRTVKIYAYSEYDWTKFTLTSTGVTINFDIGTLPSGITYLNVSSSALGTLTGNVSTLPRGLTYLALSVAGSDTISGDVSGLPTGLTLIYLYGQNTLTGNVINLPRTLYGLYIGGYNTLSGNVSDLPTELTQLVCRGSNTLSGDLSGIPRNLHRYCFIQGYNTLSGNVANLPTTVTEISVDGYNTISDYTSGRTWSNSIVSFNITPYSGGLSQIEMDWLLADLNTSWTTLVRSVNLGGTNAAPSAAGIISKNALVAKGCNVGVNT